MMLRLPWRAVALASAVAVTPVSSQSLAVQHLSSGDSIAVLMAGPAIVPNRTLGLLVRFYPFASFADTTHVRDVALALWRQLMPRLDSEGISWLVLQAAEETAVPQRGSSRRKSGFVFERGADSVWHRVAEADSILEAMTRWQAPDVLNLAGRWRITGLHVTEMTYVSLTQQGRQLRGEIVRHRDCLGKDVKMVIELEGTVDGHAVDLWSTTGHVEGEFINPCTNAELHAQLEFRGQIDAEGKRIMGPFEVSGVRSDNWTLSR